jgi:hypothetical protein
MSPLFPEIKARKEAGASTLSIARWLIEEQNAFDVTVKAMAKRLDRLFAAIESGDVSPPARFSEIEDHSVFELEELEKLATLQAERIQMVVETEKGIGHLFPSTRQEVAELRMILSTLLDRKQALGLYYSRPAASETTVVDNSMEINVNLPEGSALLSVVADDEKRRRVLNALRALSKPSLSPEEEFSRRFHAGTRGGEEAVELIKSLGSGGSDRGSESDDEEGVIDV